MAASFGQALGSFELLGLATAAFVAVFALAGAGFAVAARAAGFVAFGAFAALGVASLAVGAFAALTGDGVFTAAGFASCCAAGVAFRAAGFLRAPVLRAGLSPALAADLADSGSFGASLACNCSRMKAAMAGFTFSRQRRPLKMP